MPLTVTPLNVGRCQSKHLRFTESRETADSHCLRSAFLLMLEESARDGWIQDAARVHQCSRQAVAGYLGLYFSTIGVIAKRKPQRFENEALPPKIRTGFLEPVDTHLDLRRRGLDNAPG